jgi:hypothetical protein
VWLLVVANYGLQVLGLQAGLQGFGVIRDIVVSPDATGYFNDALAIDHLIPWLSHFHEMSLHIHSATHPPGPILFYYVFLRLFGQPAGAVLGGCAVGLMGSFGVLGMYRFAALWTRDVRTRFLASAIYALLPALILFLPEFDQIYPLASMLMISLWIGALTVPRRAITDAILFGALLALALFFAYNLLMVLPFLAYFGLYWLWRRRGQRAAWVTLLRTCAIGFGVTIGLYLALWYFTGFDPIATFRSAVANQAAVTPYLNRPYGIFLLADPYDFFLGAGMLALPILLIALLRAAPGFGRRRAAAMTVIGLATILTTDLSASLAETARVWLFLQPLVVVPMAIVLAATRRRWRLAILAMQWWILVCLKANMDFLRP